ncbi:MAG TPA: hypothetical protein VFH45_00195, partial [Acidimicrobiales bacterium]|nr:hypothetical protein [Acidimicrobiales bacterium]
GRAEAASLGLDPEAARVEFKRRAAAVLGITGAIGALGGALIQLVLRQSSLTVSAAMLHARTPAAKAAVASAHATWSVPALVVFTGAYVVLAGVTYVAYLRSPSPARSVPALAAELPA